MLLIRSCAPLMYIKLRSQWKNWETLLGRETHLQTDLKWELHGAGEHEPWNWSEQASGEEEETRTVLHPMWRKPNLKLYPVRSGCCMKSRRLWQGELLKSVKSGESGHWPSTLMQWSRTPFWTNPIPISHIFSFESTIWIWHLSYYWPHTTYAPTHVLLFVRAVIHFSHSPPPTLTHNNHVTP